LICLRPCSDGDFAEKTAVDAGGHQREKNGHFSSEINAVNTSTGKTSEIAPSAPDEPSAPLSDDDLGIPVDLLRCFHCGKPGAERWDMNGWAVHLHEACQQAWADKQEQSR